jgi:hypothetical protein
METAMNALPRSILCAAETSLEYAMGGRAARGGITARLNPFKPGSQSALRWAYGYQDELSAMRRRAKTSSELSGSK